MKRLLTWAWRAGFSILDQALVSAGNFGLSVVLARLLLPVDYGAFSVTFAAFFVAAGIHNSFVIEPMSVLGPAEHRDELVSYIGRVLQLHFLITAPLALIGAIASFFFFRTGLGLPLLTMSLCLPFMLLFWTTRRAHYLESSANRAAASSLLYCLSLTSLIAVARVAGHLNVSVSFIAMSAASVLAAAFSFRSLRVGLRWGDSAKERLMPIVREHWSFGKWILPAALLFPLVYQIQTFATGLLLGLPAAGVLRALQNAIMPAIQIVTALSLLAIPALARNFGDGRTDLTYRCGWLYTLAMVLVAGAYELVLVATGNRWDALFYKGAYAQWDSLMPVLGLVPVAAAVAAGCAVTLRAVQRPGLITAANLGAGVFGVASIYPFIMRWHFAGAIYGLLWSQVVAAIASVGLVVFAKVRPIIHTFKPALQVVLPTRTADGAVVKNA